MAHRPVETAGRVETADASGPDLYEAIRQAAIKRTGVLEVTEASLNQYLADRLEGEVSSVARGWAVFDVLVVVLQEGVARFDLRWKVGGHLQTVSVRVTVTREGDVFRVHVPEGAYGHLEVMRGFLRPMVPTFRRLGDVFETDIEQLFRMNKVEIRDGKLMLDPRF